MQLFNNQALLEAADYALVGPVDNRIHEIRTTKFPFNTVCHIGRNFGNGRWSGCSGILISPRVVLTAGHCLFSHKRGMPPKHIRVTPGRSDRDTAPFGSVISGQYYVPKKYITARSAAERRNYDYGFIILPQSFKAIKQFLPLRALNKDEVRQNVTRRRITIAGYPGDRPIGTMWHHTEKIKKMSPRRLLYTVDTCPGHSGSAIWHMSQRSKKGYIVGVHTSGILDEKGRSYGCNKATVLAPSGLLNSGVRITPEVIANIQNPSHRTGAKAAMQRLP